MKKIAGKKMLGPTLQEVELVPITDPIRLAAIDRRRGRPKKQWPPPFAIPAAASHPNASERPGSRRECSSPPGRKAMVAEHRSGVCKSRENKPCRFNSVFDLWPWPTPKSGQPSLPIPWTTSPVGNRNYFHRCFFYPVNHKVRENVGAGTSELNGHNWANDPEHREFRRVHGLIRPQSDRQHSDFDGRTTRPRLPPLPRLRDGVQVLGVP